MSFGYIARPHLFFNLLARSAFCIKISTVSLLISYPVSVVRPELVEGLHDARLSFDRLSKNG
jgi:hypothetical protein